MLVSVGLLLTQSPLGRPYGSSCCRREHPQPHHLLSYVCAWHPFSSELFLNSDSASPVSLTPNPTPFLLHDCWSSWWRISPWMLIHESLQKALCWKHMAVLLGRIFKSYLSFKAQVRIIMVSKYLNWNSPRKSRMCLKSCAFKSPVLASFADFLSEGDLVLFLFLLTLICCMFPDTLTAWPSSSP